jgi:hypothetical protein
LFKNSEAAMRAKVVDSFEIKGRVAVEYGSAGVVVIFAAAAEGYEPPFAGEPVLVVKPDGWMRSAVMGEVKMAANAL